MATPGRVLRWHAITRKNLQAHPDKTFVYADNMVRRGFGGQAGEMRGEPNAIGIPTKWRPSREASAYFKDRDWSQDSAVRLAVLDALRQIEGALLSGRDVVIPAAGIGIGLADLHRRAPVIAAIIDAAIENFTRISEGSQNVNKV